jgi:pimeloyl-ACP methyl ester carboxylesterase
MPRLRVYSNIKKRIRVIIQTLTYAFFLCFLPTCFGKCPPPLGSPLAKRLLVIAPATSQDYTHWFGFIEALRQDRRSEDIAILFFSHDVRFASFGSAYDIAKDLEACISSKMVDSRYDRITLIGHSIGGMIIRRAYLIGAGATNDSPVLRSKWTDKVERILLFASVNKGIPRNATWWAAPANCVFRTNVNSDSETS